MFDVSLDFFFIIITVLHVVKLQCTITLLCTLLTTDYSTCTLYYMNKRRYILDYFIMYSNLLGKIVQWNPTPRFPLLLTFPRLPPSHSGFVLLLTRIFFVPFRTLIS